MTFINTRDACQRSPPRRQFDHPSPAGACFLSCSPIDDRARPPHCDLEWAGCGGRSAWRGVPLDPRGSWLDQSSSSPPPSSRSCRRPSSCRDGRGGGCRSAGAWSLRLQGGRRRRRSWWVGSRTTGVSWPTLSLFGAPRIPALAVIARAPTSRAPETTPATVIALRRSIVSCPPGRQSGLLTADDDHTNGRVTPPSGRGKGPVKDLGLGAGGAVTVDASRRCTTTSVPMPMGPVSMRASPRPMPRQAARRSQGRDRILLRSRQVGARIVRTRAVAAPGHAGTLVDHVDVDSVAGGIRFDSHRRIRGSDVERIGDQVVEDLLERAREAREPGAQTPTRCVSCTHCSTATGVHVSARSATVAATSMSMTSCGAASRRARTRRDCTRRPRRAVSFTAASIRGRSAAETRGDKRLEP